MPKAAPSNFIRTIVQQDLAANQHDALVTRFPPEPNGFLHIGHAKSALLNADLAADYDGGFKLRFDDTNPAKERDFFAASIEKDLRWLGLSFAPPSHASDYFEELYQFACALIERGLAYVCSLDAESLSKGRGAPGQHGEDSPYRSRSVDESLRLFAEMRAGRHPDGAHTLRARIDMASPVMCLRDPPLYRIRHIAHHRTGTRWPIYPSYDFAQCLSDALDGVTHSLCTLEFQERRPLYNWLLEQLADRLRAPLPKQIEFAPLKLSYTVLSKRKLAQLVDEGLVSGWDDPRMPTLAGMRRRGYPPAALRNFCRRVGVARADSVVDVAMLEAELRRELNQSTPRLMCVLRPLELIIENLAELEAAGGAWFDAPSLPDAGEDQLPRAPRRRFPLRAKIYIERDDFSAQAPEGYRRLRPGGCVRLHGVGLIRHVASEHDTQGRVTALRCRVESEASKADDASAAATIHWVPETALMVEVRLYDRLFKEQDPERGDHSFLDCLNPESLSVLSACRLEPVDERVLQPGACFQFERVGYFCVDQQSQPDRAQFNCVIMLRDAWKKQKSPAAGGAQSKPRRRGLRGRRQA